MLASRYLPSTILLPSSVNRRGGQRSDFLARRVPVYGLGHHWRRCSWACRRLHLSMCTGCRSRSTHTAHERFVSLARSDIPEPDESPSWLNVAVRNWLGPRLPSWWPRWRGWRPRETHRRMWWEHEPLARADVPVRGRPRWSDHVLSGDGGPMKSNSWQGSRAAGPYYGGSTRCVRPRSQRLIVPVFMFTRLHVHDHGSIDRGLSMVPIYVTRSAPISLSRTRIGESERTTYMRSALGRANLHGLPWKPGTPRMYSF